MKKSLATDWALVPAFVLTTFTNVALNEIWL